MNTGAGIAAFAMAAVAVAVPSLGVGTHHQQRVVASVPTDDVIRSRVLEAAHASVTAPAAATPVVVASPAPVSPPAPTIAEVATTTEANSSAASPPPPACRNSSDAACGLFRWEPAPRANQPLTITVDVTPAHPLAGQPVTFRVVAEDPDAPVGTNCGSFSFDDPFSLDPQIGYPCMLTAPATRYGPWAPGDPRPGRLETSFTHVFAQPGTFTFHFDVASGDDRLPGDDLADPYASRASARATVTVEPIAAL